MSSTDHRVRLLPFHEGDSDEILRFLDEQVLVFTIDQPATLAHQVITLTLTGLLARIFPNVYLESDINIPAHPLLPAGLNSLEDRLAEIRADGGYPTSRTEPGSFRVHIGENPTAPADLYVTSDEWTSYLSSRPLRLDLRESQIVIGPLVAAARAAATVYGVLLNPYLDREYDVPEYSAWSALTYTAPRSEEIQLPKVREPVVSALLVGAGSIGGAAVFAMRYMVRLSGRLTIVDPQTLEPKNVPKGILAAAPAAVAGMDKAVVAFNALLHHEGLEVDPVVGDVTAYHATQGREVLFPLVLSAVDSIESREAIQDCLPIRVINAACSTDQITVSGHVTGNGPCVCCLHMPDVMNVRETRSHMISEQLGVSKDRVDRLLSNYEPVDQVLIGQIEAHRHLESGSLDHLVGKPLPEIWEQNLRYSEVSLEDGEMAIVAPFVTALAGFLLAGELLKAARYGYGPWSLGPEGRFIKYEEAPLIGPEFGLLTNPPRWPTSACLCQSTRRKRLYYERSRID